MTLSPIDSRPRRVRRSALGITGTVVLVAGVVAGGQAASAVVTNTTIGDLSSAFVNGDSSIVLGGDIAAPTTTLTLSPNTSGTGLTTFDLNGYHLAVQAIELTSDQGGTMVGSTLLITGTGSLDIGQTDLSHPAIEVSNGSILKVTGGTITASVPMNNSAAAIGGGPSMGAGVPQSSGSIEFTGGADVTAVGGSTGAGIGAGSGASAGPITVGGDAVVHASASGAGAAIGDGRGAAGAAILIANRAHVTAEQKDTGNSGAGVGGGASPTGQNSGSVQVGDDAVLTAISRGRGAAIGGGYHGDGGSVTVTGYATVTATADAATGEAAIGDGDFATGSGTSVTIQNNTTITATGGGAGGAGIGGGSTAYGNGSVSIGGAATVRASSVNGPGIGGQKNRNALAVSIGGTASVVATGGGNGAAIGGGDSSSGQFPSAGANVSIGSGTQVVVSAAPGISAIGAGDPSSRNFGSLSSSGTLTLAAGSTISVPSGASATSDGTVVNRGTLSVAGSFSSSGTLVSSGTITAGGTVTNTGTLTNTGTINGSGTLANSGTIVQNGTLSTDSVTGNAFRIVYDGQGGSKSADSQLVYADTVSAAGQGIASASPPSAGAFVGWNTLADGTGSALTATASLTSLAGSGATGRPMTLGVYALYQIAPVLPGSSTLPQGVVGVGYSASVGASSGTAPIGYAKATGDLPAGLALNGSTGAISGTPTTAGTFTMVVQARNSYTVSHSFTIQVVPAALGVSVSATAPGGKRYLAGATASLTISGLQANETYTVTIGGRTVATGAATSNAAFARTVTIPKSIGDGAQAVRVTGTIHAAAATATVLTASVAKSLGLKLSAKKAQAKKKLVLTSSKLYPGESVRIVISTKHGKHVKQVKSAVGKATSKGTYVLTLKSGLGKGAYTVTVTGAGTSRKATTKLTVR